LHIIKNKFNTKERETRSSCYIWYYCWSGAAHSNKKFFKLVEGLLHSLMLLFTRYKSTWLIAISTHCLAALRPRCLRSTGTCGKNPITATWSEPL